MEEDLFESMKDPRVQNRMNPRSNLDEFMEIGRQQNPALN